MMVWVGIHEGGKTSLVAPDGNVNTFHVAGHSGKTSAFHTKDEFNGNNIRLQDDNVCPYMAAAVKFLEAYGPVLVPWPNCSLDMDPIEHALDDFGRAIINRDNLPRTLWTLEP